ncbi:MAG TPA: M6 family metalloprotease domain-containing protein, partial [Longimicrobiaceae bacterium]|nr:M6 family metalloprotease domain-containing protein [Longimicrobiaceae bacterium]
LVVQVQQQPERFEFRRAWRGKTQRVRAARTQLERAQGPRLSISMLQGAGAALTGTFRVPVILGTYAGFTPPYSPAQYQTRLFGSGIGGYTAKSYYQEISRGVFTLDGTVTPWTALPQPASYYDPSSASDPMFGRTAEYLRDALASVSPTFDWGQFDNDGPDGIPNSGDDDGYVDAAAFIYPEAGKACGGPGIWPHRSTYSGWWGAPYTTQAPAHNGGFIKVDDYLIQGGVGCDRFSLMEFGTFAHEMGHALGLPDLYDTDSRDGTAEGLGEWDLMSSGNYLRESSPAHMGAWSKDFLGWVNVQTVTAPLTGYTLPPVYQAGTVLRYDLPSTREHFLLEHREASGSDAYLHGPGLLVYHVDEVVIDSTVWYNRVNAHPRQGIALMQADGLDQLGLGQNRGDAGDPFPGSSIRRAFTGATTPGSNDNDGLASGLGLQNVTLTGSSLSFDLTVGPALRVLKTVNVTANPGGSTNSALGVNSTGGSLAPQATANVPWLTVTPVGTTTPMSFSLTANTVGMAPGVHTAIITVSAAGAVNSPVAVTYNITVGTPFLQLGDSVRSRLAQGKADTIQISLASGALADVGVWSESPNAAFAPRVAIVTPAGIKTNPTVVRTEPNGGIVAGYTAATTGTYKLIVTDAAIPPNYGGQTMPYVVRTRASGPVLAVSALNLWSYQRQGSGTPEQLTTNVQNYGTGPRAFTVTTD